MDRGPSRTGSVKSRQPDSGFWLLVFSPLGIIAMISPVGDSAPRLSRYCNLLGRRRRPNYGCASGSLGSAVSCPLPTPATGRFMTHRPLPSAGDRRETTSPLQIHDPLRIPKSCHWGLPCRPSRGTPGNPLARGGRGPRPWCAVGAGMRPFALPLRQCRGQRRGLFRRCGRSRRVAPPSHCPLRLAPPEGALRRCGLFVARITFHRGRGSHHRGHGGRDPAQRQCGLQAHRLAQAGGQSRLSPS